MSKIVFTGFFSLVILTGTFCQQKISKEEIEKYTAGMYGSKASPLNIVDGTAYRKDPILALRKACDKYGIKPG